MNANKIISSVAGRDVRELSMTADQCDQFRDLAALGICLDEGQLSAMARNLGFTVDSLQGLTTTASISTPVQFLQAWLPGFVNVITQPQTIDEMVGMVVAGSWEDEEVVQGVMEPTGLAANYGDAANVPLASWNVNFERRTVVRGELGFEVGKLEEARAGRMNVNSGAEKRGSVAQALEIRRNQIGYNGYNGGANRTYGFLNDPALPAYVTAANGASSSPLWSTKTFLEITADLRAMFTRLRTQGGGRIDPAKTPITFGVSNDRYEYLTITNTLGTQSVLDWLKSNNPNVRVVAAPELDGANGGESVGYMFADKVVDGASTDGGSVMIQIVPTKFKTLGTETRAKAYLEDSTNATAGCMVKRPWAVTRITGI